MRFCVIGLASVPDTETARRMFDLHDLDDESVAKVLFHRRKQETGSSEALRWNQRAIAAVTLVQHSLDSVFVDSFDLADHDEPALLDLVYKAATRNGRIVTWDGVGSGIPLLHFRSLYHGLSYPSYWQALGERADWHVALRDWLSRDNDRPPLNEVARQLSLPGLLGHDEGSVIEAWLAGRHADVRAYSELVALNTYLIALRLFAFTGELTRHDGARVQRRLRDELGRNAEYHRGAFLSAWEEV